MSCYRQRMRYLARWLSIRDRDLEPAIRERRIGATKKASEAERERRRRASSMVFCFQQLSLFPSSTTTKEACISFAFVLFLPYLSLAADPASPTRRRLHRAASPWGKGERENSKQKKGRECGSERKKEKKNRPLSSSRRPSSKKKMKRVSPSIFFTKRGKKKLLKNQSQKLYFDLCRSSLRRLRCLCLFILCLRFRRTESARRGTRGLPSCCCGERGLVVVAGDGGVLRAGKRGSLQGKTAAEEFASTSDASDPCSSILE